jgi:hypothetical protein
MDVSALEIQDRWGVVGGPEDQRILGC